MSIITWIIFGAVVGWLASLLTGTDERYGCLANIILGVVGSLVGGFVAQFLFGASPDGFSLQHFLVALLGAIIVVSISSWIIERQSAS